MRRSMAFGRGCESGPFMGGVEGLVLQGEKQ